MAVTGAGVWVIPCSVERRPQDLGSGNTNDWALGRAWRSRRSVLTGKQNSHLLLAPNPGPRRPGHRRMLTHRPAANAQAVVDGQGLAFYRFLAEHRQRTRRTAALPVLSKPSSAGAFAPCISKRLATPRGSAGRGDVRYAREALVPTGGIALKNRERLVAEALAGPE